ncbi:alpha-N-acetyl-neuraminyl-2,3-beta-galactosyl-1,3-N-acetyl-galactosaminide alpha-2,6-sialyltransferase isoform 1-T1 [Odontesthes bonariensis]|uniref:alpha-N-acetyl-neuraminyl-2,3-beta-galactosyl-1, 3-N-acetyl-galactosaminide alpha-2,6-sialyltransferase isoform X1 n=1 Tax=Odontesthes bonariensis TaxID=219752 RepID=UPI003F58FE16
MNTLLFRRWLCLLSLSLPLLVWFGHVITRDDSESAVRSPGLKGYTRISSGWMSQLLDIHCGQCALVSSSGQMLGAGAGEEIDKIGCVIRMNNAPTKGYEKDVGSRTTVRVVSHTSVPLLVKNEKYYFHQSANTTYVFWGPERNMRQDGKGHIFNVLLKMAIKYPKVRIYAVTRDKVQYCDSVFQNETGKNRMKTGAFLSTGFFTMILAMDMCDSISVYGMIDNNYSVPIAALFLTITTRKTESMSAGCTRSTSTHSAEVTASSLRRPSMVNGQHATRSSLNTPSGSSEERNPENKKMLAFWI